MSFTTEESGNSPQVTVPSIPSCHFNLSTMHLNFSAKTSSENSLGEGSLQDDMDRVEQ